MLPWQPSLPTTPRHPGPEAPQACPARKARLPPSPPPHYPHYRRNQISPCLAAPPTTSAGLPSPSPKPHPLQAAPTPTLAPSYLLRRPQGHTKGNGRALTTLGGPTELKQQLTIPRTFGAWQKGPIPGRGWGWPLSVVEAYRGNHMREEKSAGRAIPWRQCSQKQTWGQRQDPGRDGGQASPRCPELGIRGWRHTPSEQHSGTWHVARSC